MTLNNLKSWKGNIGGFDFQQKRKLNSSLFSVELKLYIILNIKFLYNLSNWANEMKKKFKWLSSPLFSPPSKTLSLCCSEAKTQKFDGNSQNFVIKSCKYLSFSQDLKLYIMSPNWYLQSKLQCLASAKKRFAAVTYTQNWCRNN